MSTSPVLLALRRFGSDWRRLHGGTHRQHAVLERLGACRTRALGGHVWVCDGCRTRLPVYNSCDDRHCPQCGGARTARWLDERLQRMLPVPHFQVVFTLPSQLRLVAHLNPTVVYPLMFRVGASVLQDLAAQRLEARLGITSVLHTWASNLTLHPHVHCLVTAGGLALDRHSWVPRTGFLFPTRIIGQMYRGRLLEQLIDAHEAGELMLPSRMTAADLTAVLRRVAKRYRQWGVHVEAPNDRPAVHALKYLARYARRVAISDRRMVEVTATHVRLRARDAQTDGKQRIIELEGHEFVRRFLTHVLPKGFRKVRHYGVYAPGHSVALLRRAHSLLGSALSESPDEPVAPSDCEDEDAIGIPIEELDDDALLAALLRFTPPRTTCPNCGATMRLASLPSRQAAGTARGPP